MLSSSNLRAWKNHLRIPSPYKMAYFQVYFSNSARLIGLCAHDSFLAAEDLQLALNTFQSGSSILGAHYFNVYDKVQQRLVFLVIL